MAEEIEEIPHDDTVTRLIDYPRMYDNAKELIWDNIFQFPKDHGAYVGESVNWAKYAPPPEQVHRLGCTREATKREQNPDNRYVGYVAGITGDIRKIKTNRGHGFNVTHVPSEGQHHAEISYSPNTDPAAANLNRTDRIELRVALRKAFGDLVGHSCVVQLPNVSMPILTDFS